MRGNLGRSCESVTPLTTTKSPIPPQCCPDLQREIKAIIIGAVAFLRTTPDPESGCRRRLSDDASRIFGLLNREASPEDYGDVDLLQQVLTRNAELALSCMHFAYKQAGFGRMLFLWHAEIVRRLDEDRQPIVTACWVAQAEANPVAPRVPPPTRTKAPSTVTRLRIEEYLHHVETATTKDVKVDKTDFWLRPQKDGKSRYGSDTEFRAFQREDPDLSPGVKKVFNGVFKLTPDEFVEGLEERRRAYRAKKKQKSTH
jgi:hypothetical protein